MLLTETLLLPQQEVSVFRALSKTATVLLVIFRLDRTGKTPVTRNQIAALLDISRPTAGEYLESLCYQGLLTRTGFHTGYALSTYGRQLLIGQALETGAILDGTTGPLKDLGSQDAHSIIPGGQETETPLPESKNNRISESRVKKVLTLQVQSQNILPQEEEENKKENLIDLTPPPLRELNFLTLLEKSEILFGPPGVVARGLEKRPADIVLGWMAQAYNERHSLDRPAGLVYRRLKEGFVPKQQYREKPQDYLPDTYLRAVGIKTRESEPIEDDIAPYVNEPNESLTVIQAGSRFSPLHAFMRVWEELERSTVRSTYLHWMSACQPLDFSDDVLSIGVIDMETQKWLAARVTKTVETGLAGYLCHAIKIRFVVME